MAIAFQNSTTASVSAGNSFSISVPSGTTNGDFLLFAATVKQNDATPSITGWTQIAQANAAASDTDNITTLWYRRASSEPASYTFNLGNTYGNSAAGVMLRYTGVLVSGTPYRTSNTKVPTGVGTPQTSATLTGVQSTDMAIHFAGTELNGTWDGTNYTLAGPGGSWTQRANIIETSADSTPGMIAIDQLGTGTSPTFTAAGAGSARPGWVFIALALIPEPSGTTFNETPADREGLKDTLAPTQTHGVSQADREGLTDIQSNTMGMANTIPDKEGLKDTLSLAQTEPQSQADTLGLTDVPLIGLVLPFTVDTNREGLTDQIDIAKILEPTEVRDTLGLTDSTSLVEDFGVLPTDREGLTDSLVLIDPNAIDFMDALQASDNVLVALSTATTISDKEGTTDLISLTLGYWEGDHVPHSSPGFGEIYIDRFFLVEKEKATESNDGKLSIAGQESSPPTTVSLVTFLHGQVVGLQEGKVVPVIFRDKSERNAYYEIGNTSSDLTDYQSGVYGDNTVATADWTIELTRLGSDSEIDLQSRLTGAVRLNDFSLTGQKWHAPAVGHYAYYTGSTNPTAITRITSDGDMTVYLGIPNNTSPKWGCAVSDYHKGRVRILDTREVTIENEVEGLNRNISATGWSLMNGLINVSPTATAGVINIANYDGTSFYDRYVNITVGGTGSANNVAQWTSATIIRNDFEQCIIRLTSPQDTVGRTTVDLSLKRGSRIVEGYVQTGSSTTISIHNATSESGYITNAAASGYVVRSSADENGMRFVAGSARTFTSHTNGGVSKSSSTFLDFWFGAVVAPETLNSNPTFVSDVTGWSGASATVAWSTAQVHPLASGSMKVTPAGGVSAVSARSDLTGVDSITPGQTYLISGWFYSPGGWNGLYPAAQWADSSGNILSSSGTTRNVSSGTWTYLEDTVTAPASASQVRMTARADNTPTSSDVYYVWNLRIHESTPTGDAATDLRNQYIGSMPEVVYAVRR